MLTGFQKTRLSCAIAVLCLAASGCSPSNEKAASDTQARTAPSPERPIIVPAAPPQPAPRELAESPALPRYEMPAQRIGASVDEAASGESSDKPGVNRPDADKPNADKPAPNPLRDGNGSAGRKPRAGKNSGIPFDPIKENGPIFVDWPKPMLALVITGMEDGYIEPCGCAGLERMKGGMARRYTLFKQLRDQRWPVVGLDVGGIARGFGRQAELKFRTMVEGKLKMGYDAITFGADDLRLPAGELLSVAAGVDGQPSPFISANVGLFGFDAGLTAKTRIIEAAGMKIGVAGVFGKQYQSEIHNSEIEMADPEAALKKAVPELKKKADFLVLLANATMQESIELGKKFPEFNVVVTAGGPAEEPPATPKKIEGASAILIEVGHKGMDAIVLGLFDDKEKLLRYQRVPLDSRFAAAPEMKLLMAAYQDQLKAIGFAGLGLRPVPHPLQQTNGRFIGSAKCESCHEISYNIWKKSGMTKTSGHRRAYQALEKLDPPRNYDPECVSCHVVGWHPTRFFPYQSGYESLEKTPELINAGCENCHGPGEKHAAVELAGSEELKQKYRKAVVVTKAESEKQQCMTCHDLDNSPDFDFETYWPYVEHYEKDK